MTAAAGAVNAVEGARSWTHVLLGEVRREFRAEVYVPDPDDRVLAKRAPTDSQLERGPAVPCAVNGCRRSVYLRRLCRTHGRRWRRAGEPNFDRFVATAAAVQTRRAGCLVAGCDFPEAGGFRLCDAHERRFRGLLRTAPALAPADYAARLDAPRGGRGPRFDTRGLPRSLALELQFALQCRHDARASALTPRTFDTVTRWIRDLGVGSLLEHGKAWWEDRAHALRPPVRAGSLAFVAYARQRLRELRERQSGVEVWAWDTWPVDRIDLDGRWAHQQQRRIYFADIDPPWLKALAKRWARWRLSAATKSPGGIQRVTSALRRFSTWLAAHGEPLAGPRAITRALLERFLAHLAADPQIGQPRRRSIIVDLKVFLDDVRMHGWSPGLAPTATYHRGELPREAQPLPRYIDEFVMGQLEADDNLARLPDQTTRTAVRLLMETGLRSVDALRLPFDPISRDQAGAPYLVYTNHKLAREATIPISDLVAADITRQQSELRQRWPTEPPPWLFPRPWQNADGRYPLAGGTLNRRLKRWLADCDIRDAHGQPARVTSHQFRHTVGTRLVNNEVPLEIVRRLLDHNSPAMTARYARIKDATLRREWERYQQRINVRGEIIPLDPDGPVSDAAWAKENLARAKQTLPNGYCGLPLQQSCPHPNACLTCDHFLTTPEFLPLHRDQLQRTRELLATARQDGRQRLVAMNEPVEVNLLRIIDGLETLDAGDGC